MAVAVFRIDQQPSPDLSPAHYSPRYLAVTLVAARIARWVDGKCKAIHLLVQESWASLKQRFKPLQPILTVKRVPHHVLNAPTYHVPNMLAYPPNGYEANAKALQRQVWLTAQKF